MVEAEGRALRRPPFFRVRFRPIAALRLLPHYKWRDSGGRLSMVEWSEAELRKKLSARQYEVLTLVAQRFSSKEIGRQLGLSHKTVDNHVADLLARVEVGTRADAARIFLDVQQGRERLPRVVEPLDEPTFDPSSLVQPVAPAPIEIGIEPHPIGAWGMLIEILRLPPVGGRRHDLTMAQRLAKIGLIGLVSIVFMLAVVMVIVGILGLLNG